MRQMLKGWPPEDLCWWSCLPETDSRFGQKVSRHFCAAIPPKLYPLRRFTAARSAWLDTFWVPWATRHLARTLRAWQPGAIWVIPHNWSIPPLARTLPGGHHRFHVTVQDYVDVHTNPARFGRDRCARFAAMADRLYTSAATRDATSHPMIADLRARTGCDAAQMLHAGLEPEDFAFLERKVPKPSRVIRIAYAGTILVEDVFALFVAAIDRCRERLGRAVELHLFGAHSYAGRTWWHPGWMFEHGNLAESELLAKVRDCDWAFAPMALADTDRRYNRFSFPTKFISYLAAGLPIIALGHPDSSVMQMAAQYEVGFRSTASEVETLSAGLASALALESPWERYGKEIIRCAETEFNAGRMRRTLFSCFGAKP